MRGANAQGGEEARADHQRERDHQAGDQPHPARAAPARIVEDEVGHVPPG
jgi:hypothetical protein